MQDHLRQVRALTFHVVEAIPCRRHSIDTVEKKR